MNTRPPITFPPTQPELKIPRPTAEKWEASLAAERRRLQEDHDALREREANLREYESRLRALQAEIEAGRSGPAPGAGAPHSNAHGTERPTSRMPFVDDGGLQLAWEKLHRARELLEAEQAHLRDERLASRDREAAVKLREDAVAARQSRLAEREAIVMAAMPVVQPSVRGRTMSAVTRLTQAPFVMARSVFRGKK